MNVDDALRIIADNIWTNGEIKGGDGCLIPVGYQFGQLSDFNRASTVLYEEYKATHYSRTWVEKGTIVQIDLYKADAFGAAIDQEYITPFYMQV